MRWLGKRKFRFLKNQQGIGILEVLIAVAILGFIGTGVVMALDTNFRAVRTVDEHVTATNLATAYFEAIKAMPYAATYLDPGYFITIPPQYTLNVDIDFSSDGASGDGITWVDTYTDETLQRLTLTVSREGGKSILTMCMFKTKRVES